jgi:hypothetical protein
MAAPNGQTAIATGTAYILRSFAAVEQDSTERDISSIDSLLGKK